MISARLGRLLDLASAHRRLSVGAALLIGTLLHLCGTALFSWHFIVQGSRLLWSPSGLHLYATAPDLQMGPLTFVVGGLFSVALPGGAGAAAAVVTMLAAGLGAILLALDIADSPSPGTGGVFPGDRSTTVAALGAAMLWTEVAVHYAHLDDALALGAGIAAIALARRRRDVAALALVGIAIDFKPWALPLVALLLAVRPESRARAAVAVAVVVASAWLPFLVADVGTLRIFSFAIPVAKNSGLAMFGSHPAVTPPWDRPLQLGGATALIAVAAWRRRWASVLVLLVAVRMLLDPATYHYYDSGLGLGVLALDASCAARRRLPAGTIVAGVGVTAASYLLPSGVDGVVRVVSLVVIVALALTDTLRGGRAQEPAPHAGALEPRSSAPADRTTVAA